MKASQAGQRPKVCMSSLGSFMTSSEAGGGVGLTLTGGWLGGVVQELQGRPASCPCTLILSPSCQSGEIITKISEINIFNPP